MDFGTVRSRARRLADESTDPDVKALAELVKKLADECDRLKKHVRDVEVVARNS
jgi:ABC-type oligopeptide transport system substrate-binding subunit